MNGRPHIPALDGLRGLAILGVLMAHLYAPLSRTLGRLTHQGWVGVDLFFVLSGFLITGILLQAKHTPDYFRAFYARRARRIFPVYYLALIVGLFVLPTSASTELLRQRQGWYWSYTTNIAAGVYGLDGLPAGWALFWSLAVEEQFYLIWPAVIWACSTRGLVRLCVGLIATAWLLRPFALWVGLSAEFVYANTLTRMDSLCIGALLASLRFEDVRTDRLVRTAWAGLLGGGTVLAAFFVWRTQLREHDPYMLVLGLPLVTVIFGAILVLALETRARNVLSVRALTFWAPYSYGLYVWHQIVTGVMEPARWFERTHVGTALAFLAGVAMSLGAAMISWHLFEQFFLRAKTSAKSVKPVA